VFYLDIAAGRGNNSRLILRCDADGQVWASLDEHSSADGARRDAA
jgi:hypothetical protein